jgi:hypothetical protein
MISALGLELLVIPALALVSLAPIVLIALVIRDIKGKKLW